MATTMHSQRSDEHPRSRIHVPLQKCWMLYALPILRNCNLKKGRVLFYLKGDRLQGLPIRLSSENIFQYHVVEKLERERIVCSLA